MRQTLIILAVTLALSARADVIVTRGIVHTGEVVKVTSSGVQIKVGENEFTTALADILRADVAKPDAIEKSLTAFRAGKYQDALAGYKALVERYGGLPLPWAEESVVKLGDVQIALRDFTGAKRTFDSFKILYPKSPYVAVLDAKYARIMFEQKQPDQARALIQSVLDPLLKREFLTEDQEAGIAEGLILLGDCQAGAGSNDDALDSYLKVVTLFDVNDDRTAEAKYKAGKILEQNKNWRRAKQMYEELLRDNPTLAFADDLKKRLAAHLE
ncbi:MAG: tetratricopeptide repeat protein [Verrucomicrobiota bacterium]